MRGQSAFAQACLPFQLTSPTGATGDDFAAASAASTDTIVIGIPGKKVGANSFQGQAMVYRWNGAAWALEATLTASDGAANDSFGCAVALSGDTAVIGAYSKASYQGAAYVFTRSGSVWSQQAKLTASDALPGDAFGYCVSISGNTVVTGAYAKPSGTNQFQGAAYIFVRSGIAWSQQAKLTAADGATNDFFGISATISADTVAIAADSKTIGANVAQGAVYVFTRSGTVWSQQARISNADGTPSDYFGSSVSLDTNTLICGAIYKSVGANSYQGAAYAFVRSGTVWSQQAKLVASDGTPYDYFGGCVAISGETAAIGADNQTVAGNIGQGAAYTFQRTGTTWSQQAKFVATSSAAGDSFGSSVALAGTTAAIGAPRQTVAGTPERGALYVFGSNIPINLVQQPASVSTCSTSTALLSVTALGTGPFTYQWQWRSNPTVPAWLTLTDGANAAGTRRFTAQNASASSVSVRIYKQTDTQIPFADFRVIVSNACGNATSIPASIRVCWGDLNCDGLVDDSDFVIFADAYSILACSDPDMPPNCPADLNDSGIVDDEDFTIFAAAYNTLLCP